MKETIRHIDNILSPYFGRDSILREPASAHEISVLENEIGHVLPDDFKTALGIFNGEVALKSDYVGLYFNHEGLSTKGIVCAYKIFTGVLADGIEFSHVNCHPQGCLQETGFNLGWIPFASDNGGAYYAIDLNPRSLGVYGQVIHFSADSSCNIQVADSYDQFMSLVLDKYQKSRFHDKLSDNDLDTFYSAYCIENAVIN